MTHEETKERLIDREKSINDLEKSNLTFNERCTPQGSPSKFDDRSDGEGENEPDKEAFFLREANTRSFGDTDDDGLNERDVSNMPLQMPSKNPQVS